ncbi:MAG: hypothetical protein JWM36_2728 [Hyphomicrobiales bacterium]|nr:hypothetical protein [Hyphomicrobiales bacterium]
MVDVDIISACTSPQRTRAVVAPPRRLWGLPRSQSTDRAQAAGWRKASASVARRGSAPSVTRRRGRVQCAMRRRPGLACPTWATVQGIAGRTAGLTIAAMYTGVPGGPSPADDRSACPNGWHTDFRVCGRRMLVVCTRTLNSGRGHSRLMIRPSGAASRPTEAARALGFSGRADEPARRRGQAARYAVCRWGTCAYADAVGRPRGATRLPWRRAAVVRPNRARRRPDHDPRTSLHRPA